MQLQEPKFSHRLRHPEGINRVLDRLPSLSMWEASFWEASPCHGADYSQEGDAVY